jgi:hypothetical protein
MAAWSRTGLSASSAGHGTTIRGVGGPATAPGPDQIQVQMQTDTRPGSDGDDPCKSMDTFCARLRRAFVQSRTSATWPMAMGLGAHVRVQIMDLEPVQRQLSQISLAVPFGVIALK